MKAVIYARVSTEEQAKDARTSLRFQLEQCREYCQRMSYEILEEVIDPGYSGLSLDTPGLRRITELTERQAFALVSWSSDRLARDVIRRRLLAKVLKESGGRIEYATEKYDDSDTGEAIQDVLATMHWLHARKNRENVWRGQYQKAKEGHYTPRYVRLGYDWTEVIQDGDRAGRKAPGVKFVITPEEAKRVQLIFDLYEKMSGRKVAIQLNEHGYRLPCKAPKWRAKYGGRTERLFSDRDINAILKDDLYTGTVTWGRTTKLTGRTPQPQSCHFPELQIISFEQFNRTQKIMQERRSIPPKSVHSPYYFSGLLRCPHCGGRTVSRMNASSGYEEKQKRYSCTNYHRYGKTVCQGWSIFEQSVRKGIGPFLADLFENKLPIKKYLEEEAKSMAQAGAADRVGRAKETMEQGRLDLKRIQELAIKGIMNAEEAAGFVRETREKIERAEVQLKGLQTQAQVRGELAQALSLLDKNIGSVIEGLDGETLQRLCRQVFKWVRVEAWGLGYRRQSQVTGWEFTPELQDLLASQLTHLSDIARR
jgi:site-specific DNA recombinase